MGKCSISINDLYILSLEELADISEGWLENQKLEMIRTRKICYWSFLPHAKNPKRLKLTDIEKFDWEKEDKKKDEAKTKEMIDHGARLAELVRNGMIKQKEVTVPKHQIKNQNNG